MPSYGRSLRTEGWDRRAPRGGARYPRVLVSRSGQQNQYAQVVKVEPPKGPEGLTRHYVVSPSQYMAAEPGGWRRTASRSVGLLSPNDKAVLVGRVAACLGV
eukprot:scaffold26217_cov35-Phaeocystis_antarctica.AAC.1